MLPEAALAQAHTALARTRDVAGALEGLIDVLTDPDERALHRVTTALHTTRREAQAALLDAQELADRTLDGLGHER